MTKMILLFFTLGITQVTLIAQKLNSSYAIQNVNTGQNLRPYEAMSANGNKIVMYNHKVWMCMTWNFNHISGNTYTIQNQYTSKTFQAADQPARAGSILIQQTVSNKDEQHWEFIPVSENRFIIRLIGTDLYITAAGNENNSSVTLQQRKENDPLQVWCLIEQHPTN